MSLRILAIAAMVIAMVASCGGETSNGGLCQKCGPNWGNCMASSTVTGDHRPSACGTMDPCTIPLVCAFVIDTRVQRCYPTNSLDPGSTTVDDFYRCDGDRPAA